LKLFFRGLLRLLDPLDIDWYPGNKLIHVVTITKSGIQLL
jgi:hypothetical protein